METVINLFTKQLTKPAKILLELFVVGCFSLAFQTIVAVITSDTLTNHFIKGRRMMGYNEC